MIRLYLLIGYYSANAKALRPIAYAIASCLYFLLSVDRFFTNLSVSSSAKGFSLIPFAIKFSSLMPSHSPMPVFETVNCKFKFKSRSEERRVGKECKSLWWEDLCEKKIG